MPVFDGSKVPTAAPVRCANCGQELFLACGPDTMAPAQRVRSYARKPCARCLRTFQPTGPRSLYCDRDDCSSPTPQLEA